MSDEGGIDVDDDETGAYVYVLEGLHALTECSASAAVPSDAVASPERDSRRANRRGPTASLIRGVERPYGALCRVTASGVVDEEGARGIDSGVSPAGADGEKDKSSPSAAATLAAAAIAKARSPAMGCPEAADLPERLKTAYPERTATIRIMIASSSPPPQVPAASAAVKVVDPGEKVMLGRGTTMWLSDQGMFLATPNASGSAKERLMEVAEVPGGKITATAAGDGAGTVWASIYCGPEKPTRVTFSLGGRTASARIVTLPGRPGGVAFHADDTHARTNDITITVQGADGAILASLAKPGLG